MNVVIWSPTTGWYSFHYSPHYYLFKTHYKHHGVFSDQVNFLKIIDQNFDDDNMLPQSAIDQIDQFPAAVFLGIYTWNKDICLRFCRLLEQKFPNSKVFLGGPEVDFNNFSELLEYNNIHGVVKDEGEVPITETIDRLVSGAPLDNIGGLWLREGNTFKEPQQSALRIRWKDGKSPKSGNFYDIGYSWILENSDEILNDVRSAINSDVIPPDLMFALETSRGCPYGCVYCDWGGGIQQKVRRKPQELINKEVDWIIKHFTNFFFYDANYGIFLDDIETAEVIRDCIVKYDKVGDLRFNACYAKNNQDTVKKIFDILVPVIKDEPQTLELQNSDEEVQKSIKRIQKPIEVLKKTFSVDENNYFKTNIIIGLPGTTFEKDFISIGKVLDVGSILNGFLLVVSPQAPISDPEYVKEYEIKTFRTRYERFTLTHSLQKLDNFSAVHMHSCKTFSTDDFININIVNELVQLLDGAYITKWARQLANKAGYSSYEFYKPFFDKLFADTWKPLGINLIRKSISDWIFNDRPYGILGNNTNFVNFTIHALGQLYYKKTFKQDLLELVGHMHPDMEQALDIGFASLPYLNGKDEILLESDYKVVRNSLLKSGANTIRVNRGEYHNENNFNILAGRIIMPATISNVFQNV